MKIELIKIFKDKKYWKETAIVILGGVIINALCFLMGTIHSQAASDQGSRLPYNVYVGNQTDNTFYTDEVSSIIHSNTTISNYLSDATSYIVVPWSKNPSNMYFRIIKNPVFDDTIDINTFNYESTSLVVASNSSIYFQMYFYSNGNAPVIAGITQTNSPSNYLILGSSVTSSFVNDTTIKLNYPVELSDNVMKNNDNETILIYGIVYNPTDTQFTEAPLIDNVVNPSQPTLPTIQAPNIDSSQSLIDNIKALFQWLGNLFSTLINWIVTSIVNLFTNLLTNIKSFINAIITAINNGFSNIFNNFKSLFSVFFQAVLNFYDLLKQSQEDFFTFCKNRLIDISNGINELGQDYATALSFYHYWLSFFDEYGFFYNQNKVNTIINNSDFIQELTTFRTQASTLSNNFSSVQEPQTLSFTLDFSNAYYNFGVCTLSFDWIIPFRNPIRMFVIGVTVLSMLINFMEDFPSMFSGGGGHSKGTGK